MPWVLNTHTSRTTAKLNIWHTFFLDSFALILSVLTWDSAISALSLTSFNSCRCFLYLERYWLACASYKNKKKNEKISLCLHSHFFLLWHERVDKMCERNLNFWVLNRVYFGMIYKDSDFLIGMRSIFITIVLWKFRTCSACSTNWMWYGFHRQVTCKKNHNCFIIS